MQYPQTDRNNGENPVLPTTPPDSGHSTRNISERSSGNAPGNMYITEKMERSAPEPEENTLLRARDSSGIEGDFAIITSVT